jgi:large exoprotein involved in heme utilization and adhesion
MADGAKFQATNPDASTLSSAPPAVFGFLTTRPAALSVNGSVLAANGSALGPGTLGLVGGPVTINNHATLAAPAGTIHTTSAAGTGEVPIDPHNTVASTVTSFGPIDISGGSTLSVSNRTNLGSGGSVFIRSGALTVDAGQINADNYGSRSGGQLAIQADGDVVLSNGATVRATSFGSGSGASVTVTAGGLTMSDRGTSIVSSTSPTASGSAGSVSVMGSQIAIRRGAEVASTTAGTGAGGSVTVVTAGALVLDGAGVAANTQIATAATGFLSEPGGTVTVQAGNLTIEGGAHIASSTAGHGKGGDVNITVASDIVLRDPGPQITTLSNDSGDAGSITVSAVRLLMNNFAEISAEALGLTASGGNITVRSRDFLYLDASEISTRFISEIGNGGNVVINSPLVILNHSSIIAEAVQGHGGNIAAASGLFIPSSDSIISADTSGLFVGTSGFLVVPPAQLRSRTEALHETCAARVDRPMSTLAEAGRGSRPRSSLVGAGPIGVPQDVDAPLASLYLGGRDRAARSGVVFGPPITTGPYRAALDLRMFCE